MWRLKVNLSFSAVSPAFLGNVYPWEISGSNRVMISHAQEWVANLIAFCILSYSIALQSGIGSASPIVVNNFVVGPIPSWSDSQRGVARLIVYSVHLKGWILCLRRGIPHSLQGAPLRSTILTTSVSLSRPSRSSSDMISSSLPPLWISLSRATRFGACGLH